MRARDLHAMSAIVALGLLVAPSAGAQPACEVTVLPSPGQAVIADIARDGRIVGAVTPQRESAVWQPALWDGAQLVVLPTPTETFGVARAVNAAGTVVGSARPTRAPGGAPVPLVWVNRKLARLPLERGASIDLTQAGSGVLAADVNDRGQIVGSYADERACLLWASAQATPIRIGPPDATTCAAEKINARGDVLMRVSPPGSGTWSAPWDLVLRRADGSFATMTAFETDRIESVSRLALDDAGTVVGSYYHRSGMRTFLWSTSIRVLQAGAVALNDAGDLLLETTDEAATENRVKLTLHDARGETTPQGVMGLGIPPRNVVRVPDLSMFASSVAMNDARQVAWTRAAITESAPRAVPARMTYDALTCRLR